MHKFWLAARPLLWYGAALTTSIPAAGQAQLRVSSSDTLALVTVMRAAAEHPLATAARARVTAARGGRITAGALPNPVLTYQQEGDGSARGGGMPIERMTFAMLPLDPLWQRGARVARANAELRGAAAGAEQTRRQITVDAARAYFDVGVAQTARDVARAAETNLDTIVRFNRVRVAEGITAEGDLVRVELELNRASAERAMADADLSRTRARLAPFLPERNVSAGLAVSAPSSVAELQETSLSDLNQLRANALDRRPDVLAARARVRGARARISVERSLLLRDVSVMGGTIRIENGSAPMFGASLPLPLFDQNRGGRMQASAESAIAERELAWLERTALAELDAAHAAVATLGTAVRQVTPDLVRRAAESQEIAIAAYREGAVTVLHVIDATRAAQDARLTYERLLAEWQMAVLELRLAAGLDPVAATQEVR